MYRRRRSILALAALAVAATGARQSVRRRRRGAIASHDAARRLEGAASEETGEPGASCPFCSAGLDDPGRGLPTSPGDEITCGELADFAASLGPADGLCTTALRAEALCCADEPEPAVEEAEEPASTAGTTTAAKEPKGCGTVYYTLAETDEFSTLGKRVRGTKPEQTRNVPKFSPL